MLKHLFLHGDFESDIFIVERSSFKAKPLKNMTNISLTCVFWMNDMMLCFFLPAISHIRYVILGGKWIRY